MAPFGLGAPAVDCYVEFDAGRAELAPGVGLRGVIHVTPRKQLQVNRLGGQIGGTEEYAYDETDYDEGMRTTNRRWGSKDLLTQEVTLLGPGVLSAGVRQSVPFSFPASPSLEPSFESDIIRARWKLTFWLDVSGIDPHVEVPIYVPLLGAGLAAGPPDGTLIGQFPGNDGGRPFAIWLQPSPLLIGTPFNGLVDAAEQFDLGLSRAELKLDVVSTTDDGAGGVLLAQLGVLLSARRHVSISRVLWRTALVPVSAGAGYWRYSFSGVVPNEAVVTAVLPHGGAKATLDIVVSRALRRDLVEGERNDAHQDDDHPADDENTEQGGRDEQDAAHVLGNVDVLGGRLGRQQAPRLGAAVTLIGGAGGPVELARRFRGAVLDHVLGDDRCRLELARYGRGRTRARRPGRSRSSARATVGRRAGWTTAALAHRRRSLA